MEAPTQDLFAAARDARRQGRFDDSVRAYDAILALEPGNLAARIERAAALSQGRRIDEAANAIAGVLADAPDHRGAQMEAGFIARAQGRHAAELGHFEMAAAGAERPAQALIQVAQAAIRLGRLPRALEAARAAAASEPGLPAAWIAQAQACRALGDDAGEQDALRQAATVAPDDPAPLMELANAALRAGDGPGALDLLDQAEACTPRPPLIDVVRGHAALAAGDAGRAIEAFQRGFAQNPAVIGAATGLVHGLLRARRIGEAEQVLDQAQARFGDHPALLDQRAALLLAEARWDEAREALRAAHAGAREGRFARWQAWMQAELQAGTPAEQAACIGAAAPAGPAEQAAVARAEGQAAEAGLDFAAAGLAYGRAQALAPEHPETLDGLARIAALHLRHEEALALLKRHALAEAPQRRREGRSVGASQSTTGQVALDFRLDRDGSAALRDILPLPPAERLAPLRAAVRELPQSIPVALWLAISLRQAGLGAAAGAGEIPRRLLWLRLRDGAAEAERLARWRAVNPGAEVVEMGTREAVALLEAQYGAAGRLAWTRPPEPEVRVNLVRLAWLARSGGWSAAPGALPVMPLERLAGGGTGGFRAVPGAWGAPGMALLGAAAGDAVAARAAGLAVEALARGDMEHPWLRCGPGLVVRAVAAAISIT